MALKAFMLQLGDLNTIEGTPFNRTSINSPITSCRLTQDIVAPGRSGDCVELECFLNCVCCTRFFELRERIKSSPNIKRMLRFSHDDMACGKRVLGDLCVLEVSEGGWRSRSGLVWAMDCNFKNSQAISANS